MQTPQWQYYVITLLMAIFFIVFLPTQGLVNDHLSPNALPTSPTLDNQLLTQFRTALSIWSQPWMLAAFFALALLIIYKSANSRLRRQLRSFPIYLWKKISRSSLFHFQRWFYS